MWNIDKIAWGNLIVHQCSTSRWSPPIQALTDFQSALMLLGREGNQKISYGLGMPLEQYSSSYFTLERMTWSSMGRSGRCKSFHRLHVILWLIMGGWTTRRCSVILWSLQNATHQSIFAVVKRQLVCWEDDLLLGFTPRFLTPGGGEALQRVVWENPAHGCSSKTNR